MMNTPICDFASRYARSGMLRAHMPGHKGEGSLGFEELDITEISGADSLYEADGIIRESENNASALFGCDTFYSTEGSSQCIRAMVYLTALHAKRQGRCLLIAAGRNAHKTFLSAAALTDAEVLWISSGEQASYLSCPVDAQELDEILSAAEEKPVAVYLTSPDYLGNTVDIEAISKVCHRHGALLLVDNAHGAYLRFLSPSQHPIDLGADVCCDSAHKTLPVLTGGAYLHVSGQAPQLCRQQAKNALAMFGSTSPSYIILQSLDAANAYLADGYEKKLSGLTEAVRGLRGRLTARGYTFCGDELMKLTLSAKLYGYTGLELADILLEKGIVCEFADPDFLVMMVTPETGAEGLKRIERALTNVPRMPEISDQPPVFGECERVMSVREAAFSDCEVVAAKESAGRILAAASVGCPPAVPIVVCGEKIDDHAVQCFEYYGIERCTVVRE